MSAPARNAAYGAPPNAANIGRAAARFLDPDPVFWLEQAGIAGMMVWTDGKLVFTDYTDGVTPRTEFLDAWLRFGGGRKALRELLIQRQAAAAGVPLA